MRNSGKTCAGLLIAFAKALPVLVSGLVLLGAASVQAQLVNLHSFGGTNIDGQNPVGRLIQSGSKLYGTTPYGGTNSSGIVFSSNTNGGSYAVLHVFSAIDSSTGTNVDGANPIAGLMLGADGRLYGTTRSGGANNGGTVFAVSTNGSSFSVLYTFGSTNLDGLNPSAGLVQGIDGRLYGTTAYGGTNSGGIVFCLSTNGSGYADLHAFGETVLDGMNPSAGLVQGSDGRLYGTTENGGTNFIGTVFGMNTNGGSYAVLHTFGSTNNPGSGANVDGSDPLAGLVQGSDGRLYGTTYGGGTNSTGVAYRLNTDGRRFTVLHTFAYASNDGMNPAAPVVQGSNGKFYGTTFSGGTNGAGIVFDLNADGSGFTVFYAFSAPDISTGTNSDGANPAAGLIQGGSNKFYGATQYGGTNGYGAAFSIFADTTLPTVAFTLPTAGLLVSNAAFTAAGTAGDNAGLAGVLYQLNAAGWNSSATANGWTNWTASAMLTPGTNFVQAYAVDTSGNVSATNSVTFIYVLNAPLTVSSNGNGTVNPDYNGALLRIGQNYAMTAVPTPGYTVLNWTGTRTTNAATLLFTMASNLAFTANFVNLTNPPLALTFTAPNSVAVLWPSAATNFVLQTNGDLTIPNWVNYGSTVNSNGTVKSITVAPKAGNLFFRLISP